MTHNPSLFLSSLTTSSLRNHLSSLGIHRTIEPSWTSNSVYRVHKSRDENNNAFFPRKRGRSHTGSCEGAYNSTNSLFSLTLHKSGEFGAEAFASFTPSSYTSFLEKQRYELHGRNVLNGRVSSFVRWSATLPLENGSVYTRTCTCTKVLSRIPTGNGIGEPSARNSLIDGS